MTDGRGRQRRGGAAAVEPLERRLCRSAATVGTASGSLSYEYPAADGSAVRVPLVGRVVYDDAAGTGAYAVGDPVATTDLRGDYTIGLTGPSQTVRALPRPGWAAVAAGTDSAVASPGDAVAAFRLTMTDPTVIDVAVDYTASATRAYGPTPVPINDTVDGLFAYANQVQADSDTNVRLNLVTTAATTYTESGTFADDLQALSGDTIPDVAAASKAAAADLTVLVEGDANRGNGGEIGLAYEFARGRPDATQGVTVVSLLGNATRDGVTLAHEFGHLLGADHDPAHATGGAAPYARGYDFTGDDGVTYQDVMSYGAGTFLPFYSTPASFYAGHAQGRVTHGNNARVVRANGPAVARYATSGDEGPTTADALATAPATVVQSVAVRPAGRTALGGTRGTVLVTLANAGVGTVAGSATVAVTLDAGGVDPAGVTTATVAVTLRAGASRTVAVPVTWPTGSPSGTDRLGVTTTVGGTMAIALDGPTATTPLAYVRPTVDLSVTAADSAARAGRTAILRVRLSNSGTTVAVGTVGFSVHLTPSDGSAAAIESTVPARSLAVPAGRSRTLAVAVLLPADLPAGSYRVTTTVAPTTSPADANAADKTAVSSLTVI